MKFNEKDDWISVYLHIISRPHRGLLQSEIDTFRNSISKQLEMFSMPELFNLIQIGHVAVNLRPLLSGTFNESDVYILFADFGPTLDYMLKEWNLSWVICFNYFHCHVFPTTDEENPAANPRWNEIVSLPRVDLISKLNDFMYPMFSETFEICFLELLNELGI